MLGSAAMKPSKPSDIPGPLETSPTPEPGLSPGIMPDAMPLGIGGPGMAIGQPEPVPPRTPDHFVCMRGPCRHYWHVVTMAHAGNPESTWKELGIPAPRKHNHVCLRGIEEMELEEDNVFECSLWDPMDEKDLVKLRTRREVYYRKHPEHKPIDASEIE